MKKYLLILFTSLLSLSAVFGQDDAPDAGQPGGRLQERMREYIQKRLNLSGAEAEKFSPVFSRYMLEVVRTHREFKNDPPMRQLKVAEIRVRFRDQFRQILDDKRANRVFQHEREFQEKVITEMKERNLQQRRGPGNRVRQLGQQRI